MKLVRRFWSQLFPPPDHRRLQDIEDRLDLLEKDERRKRKARAQTVRRARLHQKWLNNLKREDLTEEERREWMAGD